MKKMFIVFILFFSYTAYSQTVFEYYNRALEKQENEDYYGAISDYTKAIELMPDNIPALYNRASLRSKLGDNYKAISDYTKVIELNFKSEFHFDETLTAKAYYNIGVIKENIGDLSGACSDWQKVAVMTLFRDNSTDAIQLAKKKINNQCHTYLWVNKLQSNQLTKKQLYEITKRNLTVNSLINEKGNIDLNDGDGFPYKSFKSGNYEDNKYLLEVYIYYLSKLYTGVKGSATYYTYLSDEKKKELLMYLIDNYGKSSILLWESKEWTYSKILIENMDLWEFLMNYH